MNRETWLNNLASLMAPRFAEMGFPIKKYRVSVGFTSGGQRSNAAAEVWHESVSEDGTYEILVMPDQVEPNLVACHLAHELTHVAVGFEHKHKGDFAKVALALGMNRPMTATTPGPAFVEWVAPFLAELGPLPHAKLKFSRGQVPDAPRAPAAPGEPADDAPEFRVGGKSTAKPKQSTRLIKCTCSSCGYTVRTTQKWLDVGAPHCPEHGAMDVANDNQPGADEDAA
ncbi:hypothetical protein CPT_Mano_028 [Achromobacter phage Mano]|uniref:SprT-like domain-containing protein n=1 Tax=Achromobacter phage Mano TaxID=2767570 RepID=A0A7L8G865_9CAUD|nr:hypothetical protein KB680_gp63 [Achromobacter phage Mano]QOE32760.1 hypothetical protein CPT_Mano_028 [Achromobacter phage Mano]